MLQHTLICLQPEFHSFEIEESLLFMQDSLLAAQ